MENGSESATYLGHLPGNDIYAESGLETFTLNGLPDGENASLVLATAQVQIWPLATASINVLEENASYALVPSFTVDLTNVYPESQTYIQLYPGSSEPGTEGTMLNESVLVHRDVKTRNGVLSFPNLGTHLTEDGLYTIEVITKTPFGEDILESLTFEFDNTIEIRGNFNTID